MSGSNNTLDTRNPFANYDAQVAGDIQIYHDAVRRSLNLPKTPGFNDSNNTTTTNVNGSSLVKTAIVAGILAFGGLGAGLLASQFLKPQDVVHKEKETIVQPGKTIVTPGKTVKKTETIKLGPLEVIPP